MSTIEHSLSRTELLVGKDGIDKLKSSKVVVFGVGGVGGFVVEALTRAGIGELILIDNDTVSVSNLNRQLIARLDTIDKVKVEVLKERVNSINKACKVTTHAVFVNSENIPELIPSDVDYVVDAIDTVSSKIALIEYCTKNNIRIMSSMGTGNKFDPTKFEVADIYKTSVCPLAKVMRYELKRRGVKKLKVVYSTELPTKPKAEEVAKHIPEGSVKRQVPGSISFVPPVAGMIIGGEVIKDILGINK